MHIPLTGCGGGPRTLPPTTRYWWWMSCPLGRSPVESDALGGGGRLRSKVATQPAGEGAGGNDGVGRAQLLDAPGHLQGLHQQGP
jgi:hypothetical protein